MSNRKKTILIYLLLLFLLPTYSFSEEIFLIVSYHQKFPWVKDFEKGFFENVNHSLVKKFYLNAKVGKKSEIAKNINYVLKQIKTYKPQIIVCLDDFALDKICRNFFNDNRFKIVFAGINKTKEYYNLDNVKNATGVFEHIYFEETFKLIKDSLPDINKILLLHDGSESAMAALKNCPTFYKGIQINLKNISNFSDWKTQVLNAKKNGYDAIIILTCAKIKNEKNKFLNNVDVLKWTITHNKLPEIVLLQWMIKYGALMGITISGYNTGVETGKITNMLLMGKTPEEINHIHYTKADVTINLDRAKKLGIKIPLGILMFAKLIKND